MSEPFMPLLPPEPDSNEDPWPPRCGTCRSIISLRDPFGYEGWCGSCEKMVSANYSLSEGEEWEGRERSDYDGEL